MTNVWVLEDHFAHEGFNIHAIVSSEEVAKAWLKRDPNETNTWREIECIELNSLIHDP